MTDAELIESLRLDFCFFEAADRIEQLVATNEALTDAFASLEKAASDVARRGAQIGPQWTKLTIALLVARATLAEISSHNKGESHE